jgi:hypothetical protein
MSRYYFSLADGMSFEDVDGLELEDVNAAREEAIGVARDLMRLLPERRDWSGCIVRVTDDGRNLVFDLRFLEAE